MARGVAKFKNVSDAPYAIAEIAGHVVAPGAEVDLMDDTLPVFYTDQEALKYVMSTPGCSVYDGVQSGVLSLVELKNAARSRLDNTAAVD